MKDFIKAYWNVLNELEVEYVQYCVTGNPHLYNALIKILADKQPDAFRTLGRQGYFNKQDN